LYFWDIPLIFQFAFIKTGLDPTVTHKIKIVVRDDKNINSDGSFIRHMAFEYSAESYWALAGFSSVAGKNNWYYQGKKESTDNELNFNSLSNEWSNEAKCVLGNNYQIPVKNENVVRKWLAPHDGYVRIEGTISVTSDKVIWDPVITYVGSKGDNRLPSDNGNSITASLSKNGSNLFVVHLESNNIPSGHDLYVMVKRGDSLCFTVVGGS
jgi:hypothetical protein